MSQGARDEVAFLTCRLARSFLPPVGAYPASADDCEIAEEVVDEDTLIDREIEFTDYWRGLLEDDAHLDANYWYVARRWSGPRAPQPTATALAVAAWASLVSTCNSHAPSMEVAAEESSEHPCVRRSRAPEAIIMER